PHLPQAGRGSSQIRFADAAERANAVAGFRFSDRTMAGRVAAVVVAAGRGLRAGGDQPKQYRRVGGKPVIRPSLAVFAGHPEVMAAQPVLPPDDGARFEAASAALRLLPPVFGGATRQASVRAGLEALAARRPDVVLVHDAARPFVSAALVTQAIAAATSGA